MRYNNMTAVCRRVSLGGGLIYKAVSHLIFMTALLSCLFAGTAMIGYADSVPGSGPLIISEVVTANTASAPQSNGEYCDWVELKNNSGESLNLADYYLTDTEGVTPDQPGNGKKLYRLPKETLKPGTKILIYCSDDMDDAYHTGFGLDSGYDQLFLYKGSELVDYVELNGIPVNSSYGRDTDGQLCYYSTVTPLGDNAGGAAFVSEKPTVSVPQGVYEPGTELVVELQGNGVIYYTLDGSVPTESDTVYSSALIVSDNTVIRAVCRESGGALSSVASFSYIFDSTAMPVVSLVVDNYSEFRSTYMNITAQKLNLKEIEYSSEMTFFDGEDGFSIPCGLRMRGYTSLNAPKKSMAVYFRDRYGKDSLHYDVFGNGIDKYSSLCLRAGQDYNFAYIRNEVMQELCLDMDANVATQESRYTVLYINGNYWGMFCLKEDFSSQYYASHYNISKSSVERENAPFGRDSVFFNEVYKYVENNSVSTAEGYAYISNVLDLDSLIDWIILEGVSGNTDTLHNCAVFRSDELNGKWRFAFYDLDWGFYYENMDFQNILLNFGNGCWDMKCLATGLLQVEEFRTKFLTRFAEVNAGVLSTESILTKIDELTEIVRVEASRDTLRWTQHSENSWLKHVENMKNMIINYDWSNHNKKIICDLVDGAEEFFLEYDAASATLQQ